MMMMTWNQTIIATGFAIDSLFGPLLYIGYYSAFYVSCSFSVVFFMLVEEFDRLYNNYSFYDKTFIL